MVEEEDGGMCVDFVFLWWMECVVGGGVLLLLLLLSDLAVGEDGERTTKRGDKYSIKHDKKSSKHVCHRLARRQIKEK